MLEKFIYINITNKYSNITEHVEKLFLNNGQELRYNHVCSVAKQIEIIAEKYGLDKEKCYIAAILHDIGTLVKPEDMLVFAQQNQWGLCDAEISHPFLLHQRMSKIVAKEDFSITDKEILEAVAYHTSLCENATDYQMALFIADKLAWSCGGYPPYYEQMSKALENSLEAACYEYIRYMENEGKMYSIHTDWAKAVACIKAIIQRT